MTSYGNFNGLGITRRVTITTIKKLFRAFKDGATITSACQAAGISRTRFYDINHFWPKFRFRVDQLMVNARVKIVEDSLFAQAAKGNVGAQKFFLINKAGYKMGDSGSTNFNRIDVNMGQGSSSVEKKGSDEDKRFELNFIGVSREAKSDDPLDGVELSDEEGRVEGNRLP